MDSLVPVTRLLLKATLLLSLMVPLSACGDPSGTVTLLGDEGFVDEPDSGVLIGHNVGLGVLNLVNDRSTDVDFLDHECFLDVRAAERIVAHRQGPDGIDGNDDDDFFETLGELDDVGLVGSQTMILLGDAAERFGMVPVLQLEGVVFTESEVADTLALINQAPLDVLDVDASLDVRAAQALVYGRPFESLVEVAERPFVGPSALTSLKWFAAGWVDSM